MTDTKIRNAEIGELILSKLTQVDAMCLAIIIGTFTPESIDSPWFVSFCKQLDKKYEAAPFKVRKAIRGTPTKTEEVLKRLSKLETEDRQRLLHDLVAATPEIAKTEWFQKANGEAQ